MRIIEAVCEALQRPRAQIVQIVADWIEEFASGHPEAVIYVRRLRDIKTVRVQTLVDAVLKFGTRPERKAMARIQRLALRRRKSSQRGVMAFPPMKLYDLKERRRVNRLLGNICPEGIRLGNYGCQHKRIVLHEARKRHAFLGVVPETENAWWYLRIIKQLLSCWITEPERAE